jgi:hypothetical protein
VYVRLFLPVFACPWPVLPAPALQSLQTPPFRGRPTAHTHTHTHTHNADSPRGLCAGLKTKSKSNLAPDLTLLHTYCPTQSQRRDAGLCCTYTQDSKCMYTPQYSLRAHFAGIAMSRYRRRLLSHDGQQESMATVGNAASRTPLWLLLIFIMVLVPVGCQLDGQPASTNKAHGSSSHIPHVHAGHHRVHGAHHAKSTNSSLPFTGHHQHHHNPHIHANASEWANIPMPSKSLYSGFDAPGDENRWRRAVEQAISGEMTLLHKVLETIKSPLDFMRDENEGQLVFG